MTGTSDIVDLTLTLEEDTKYVVSYGFDNVTMSSPDGISIVLHQFEPKIGRLLSGPGVPTNLDFLQDNIVLDIDDIYLNMVDAGYDPTGPFGVGTYIIGDNFSTQQESNKPEIKIRSDEWSKTIGFFNEPKTREEGFRVRVISRLLTPNPQNVGSSFWANQLEKSNISDGLLFFEATSPCDTMKVIKDGTFTMLGPSSITIAYGNVSTVYPKILITPIGP